MQIRTNTNPRCMSMTAKDPPELTPARRALLGTVWPASLSRRRAGPTRSPNPPDIPAIGDLPAGTEYRQTPNLYSFSDLSVTRP